MRETSLIAYSGIKDNTMCDLVFKTIKKLGCPTDLEVAKYLGCSDPNRVRPRRNELLKSGMIVECEKRLCSVSGKLAFSWRVCT